MSVEKEKQELLVPFVQSLQQSLAQSVPTVGISRMNQRMNTSVGELLKVISYPVL